MKVQTTVSAVGVLLMALLCTPAVARDPFEITVTLNSVTRPTLGFANLEQAIDTLQPEELLQRYGGNPGDDPVQVSFDFRGLPATFSFDANSGILFFSVVNPSGGAESFLLDRQFGRDCSQDPSCEQARREALNQLKDFLKTDKVALKTLLTALARFSPIDPLAGNSNSLMTRSMSADFREGFRHKVSQIWGCGTTAFNFTNDAPIQVAALGSTGDIFAEAQARAAAMRAGNELGMGVIYTSGEAGDFKTTAIELPLSYIANFDRLPGHKLRFDLPLSYVDSEGAASYSAGLGIAYTYPVSEVWTLTSGVGVGATGSDDLGAAGGVGSLSLTSAYTWRLGDWALSMGNGIGKYDSLPLKIGDVEAEADISNVVISNGLLLTGPNSLIAKNLVMEYSIQDTRLSGDEVYSASYDEFGVALGYIDTDMGVIDSYIKGGVSYLVGENDIKALKLNFLARF